MSLQKRTVGVSDHDGESLYRMGSLCALVFGIAYIVIIFLYVPVGAPPPGAEARLTYLVGNSTRWWTILGLSVLTDFLLVPLMLALYLALKAINRNAMLIATACVGLFVILDLAITWTNYATLITLSGNYAAAANDSQKAIIVAEASYPSAILESSLLFVYNTLTLSLGILLTGFVMRRGIFGKSTAYLGIVTGIAGMIAVAGSLFISTSSIIIIASLATTVWIFFVGYGLYRLAPFRGTLSSRAPDLNQSNPIRRLMKNIR